MFVIRHLKLRWKLLVMIVPLVLAPMILSTSIIGYVAIKQIYQEVAKANKADLEHMSVFTLDLLKAYHQQRETSKEAMQAERRQKLDDLIELAFRLVDSQYFQAADGIMSEEQAKAYAYRSLKNMSIGKFGYIYVMNSSGDLIVHGDREGENIIDVVDDRGRPFISEMCRNASQSKAKETLFISYPWSSSSSGYQLWEKEVAYRYFSQWDWIIAAGAYLEGENRDQPLSGEAFANLRQRVTGKPVDRPGHIYAMDCSSRLALHAER